MRWLKVLFRRRRMQKWHPGQDDWQPKNGWESYADHCLDHDKDGL